MLRQRSRDGVTSPSPSKTTMNSGARWRNSKRDTKKGKSVLVLTNGVRLENYRFDFNNERKHKTIGLDLKVVLFDRAGHLPESVFTWPVLLTIILINCLLLIQQFISTSFPFLFFLLLLDVTLRRIAGNK